MPIVSRCSAPGCTTVTVGPLCIAHSAPVQAVFTRGRPYLPARADRPLAEVEAPRLALEPREATAVTM